MIKLCTRPESEYGYTVFGLSNVSDIERSDSLRFGSPSRVRAECASADAALGCSRRCGSAADYAVHGRLLRYAVIHEPKPHCWSRGAGKAKQLLPGQRHAVDERLQRSLDVTPSGPDGGVAAQAQPGCLPP